MNQSDLYVKKNEIETDPLFLTCEKKKNKMESLFFLLDGISAGLKRISEEIYLG